jgi:hypothetical protein
MKTLKLLLFSLAIATFCISCDKTESKQDTPCGTKLTTWYYESRSDISQDTTDGTLTYSRSGDSAQMYFTWYKNNLCGDSEPRVTWKALVSDSLNNIGTIYFEVDWYILFQYKMKAKNPLFEGYYTYESEYTVGLTQIYSGEAGQIYTSIIFVFKSFGSKAQDFAFFKRQLNGALGKIEYYPFK